MVNAPDPRAANPSLALMGRTLSEEEKLYANEIIDLGQQMIAAMDRLPMLRGHQIPSDHDETRPYALHCARSRAQEAVFWALQFLTS